MAFEEQTFATREILTIITGPAKLNALDDNNDALKSVLVYSMIGTLPDNGGTASSSYVTDRTLPVYVDADYTLARVAGLLYNTGGGAAYVQVTIAEQTPVELSMSGSTPTLESGTIDLTGLTPGWYDCTIKYKNGGSGTARYAAIAIIADAEGVLT